MVSELNSGADTPSSSSSPSQQPSASIKETKTVGTLRRYLARRSVGMKGVGDDGKRIGN